MTRLRPAGTGWWMAPITIRSSGTIRSSDSPLQSPFSLVPTLVPTGLYPHAIALSEALQHQPGHEACACRHSSAAQGSVDGGSRIGASTIATLAPFAPIDRRRLTAVDRRPASDPPPDMMTMAWGPNALPGWSAVSSSAIPSPRARDSWARAAIVNQRFADVYFDRRRARRLTSKRLRFGSRQMCHSSAGPLQSAPPLGYYQRSRVA